MSPTRSRFGWVLVVSLAAPGSLMAQPGGIANQDAANDERPAKPTGPAAKKADDLIRAYTARIEKEIERGRNEVERLRTELHELIDVRYAMSDAIAELRGEMASKGTYSAEPFVTVQAAQKRRPLRHRQQRCSSTVILSTVLAAPCPRRRQSSNVSSSGGWRPGPT